MTGGEFDLYEMLKGRAYGLAQTATGCSNQEAKTRGFRSVYDMLMSDSEHMRQQTFLATLENVIPSEGHRRILLNGMAKEFTDLPDWPAYVARETA